MQGIYSITNQVNGKAYVGQDSNMPKRWEKHRQKLQTGIHKNPILQSAWNIYGEGAFAYDPFLCGPFNAEDLTELEQFYMDKYRAEGKTLYNILPANRSRAGMTNSPEHNRKIAAGNRGKIRTLEMRQKASIINKAWAETHANNQLGKHPSLETRQKNSDSHKGNCQSPETRAKIAATLRVYHANRSDHVNC
jgi:group I intron endonuclease